MKTETELKPWQQAEAEWLENVSKRCDGDVDRIASKTGWSVATVRTKLMEYGIVAPRKGKR